MLLRLVTAFVVEAVLGLAAGSPFATYELAAITIVIFDEMCKLHRGSSITVMVDDVSLELEDEDEELLLAEFVKAARRVAQGLLEHHLLPDKAFTLASSFRLVRAAAAALGDGSEYGASVRRLGVDHALEASRKT